jgi:A/G-specific adenine glycosylase
MNQFRKKLLVWYRFHGRHDLPWRKKWSPYHVLVSELMLQQTTVGTVVPYFHKFLKRFPDFEMLAKAHLDKVMKLWSGLGYYSRARHLHEAAKMVVREMAGNVPDTEEGLRRLPGVGRYTAGAILSFAFNKPAALVDGNVVRVLSRIHGIRADVKSPKVIEKIWKIACRLIPLAGARHYNSALMDFGATVCRPKNPACTECPMNRDCWANRHGKQNEIPRIVRPQKKKVVRWAVFLIEKGGRWVLVKRPERGLYGGLWEFPKEEMKNKDNLTVAAKKTQKRLTLSFDCVKKMPAIKHVLSHRTLLVQPWLCRWRKQPKKCAPSSSSPNVVVGDPALDSHLNYLHHRVTFGACGAPEGQRLRRGMTTLKWVSPAAAQKMGISSLDRRVIKGLD